MMAKRVVIDQFKGEYSFLSNFYSIPIVFQSMMYPSAEHAFQAAKSLDPTIRAKIAKNPSPSIAKRMGRNLILRSDWKDIKDHVMEEVVAEKFGKSVLKKKLLATGNALLIEGNYWSDRYWGACETPNGAKALPIWEGNNHLWYGRNKLGKILMELRDKLNG
jgi:ribA/ribD-fused uncharacterized protein